jgi:hypothetical protein
MSELVPAMGGLPSKPVLVTIGDIACSQDQVFTPSGAYPLVGTTWIVADNTTTTETTPSYAIVLAIVFFLACLLGLLFLLIKERRTQGYVMVSVQGQGLYHATQIPVSSPSQVAEIGQRVNHARGLVAALRQ